MAIRLFVAGDVMTGRGIDQILSHPSQPVLYEAVVRDARTYVQLAERVHGPVPQPVDDAYIWGDALAELARADTDVRIINLETSITTSQTAWPGKPIHYRMHPHNIGCLTAASITCCCLANNHVLDWGEAGLLETLQTLDRAGIAHAGAGRDAAAAAAPAVLEVPGQGRVLVFAFGSPSSGIPHAWGATADRPGVNLLADLSDATARQLAHQMRQATRPGDVLVASIHWGPNWGYAVPDAQRAFARRLVAEGVALVHGHSSHHVKTIEVAQDRLILYGCGDCLTDYEGIGGYEAFRSNLALLYLVTLDPPSSRLVAARLVPVQTRRFRLQQASPADARWLAALLSRLGAPVSTRAELADDGSLILDWAERLSGATARA